MSDDSNAKIKLCPTALRPAKFVYKRFAASKQVNLYLFSGHFDPVVASKKGPNYPINKVNQPIDLLDDHLNLATQEYVPQLLIYWWHFVKENRKQHTIICADDCNPHRELLLALLRCYRN